ncbi:MAG: hypothetical protein CVU56_16450 [Deltaproteobacteria bacterium HGW-Deltaproteobacteria-14]|jgi:site-specific recombinase|nr:MAG: hypothetical protein CVU56_16450 [Deltaproteobacteria bacterium HGW-Deltaproteobacteria-14]
MGPRRDARDLREVLAEVRVTAAAGDPVGALASLVDALRPLETAAADARVAALCDRLEVGPAEVRRELAALVRGILASARCVHALTESGVPSGHGFFDELLDKVGRRFLPDVGDPQDLRAVIRRVFPKQRDYHWLGAVDEVTWRRLLDLLGVTAESVVGVPAELSSAVRILAHHVASLGLLPEITDRMPLDGVESPFLVLSDRVRRYTDSFDNDVAGDEDPLLVEALETLAACRDAVTHLRANKHVHGTSLRLTTLTFRLLRQVERLEVLLHLTEPIQRDFQRAAIALFRELVEAENTRNHVGRHVKASADLLAYQIVEHAAKKGSKYITTTRREFGRFFVASVGGGLIVAVFALFKLLLAKADLSLGAEALLYSLNYAACFILIYLTGAALATKQPAMTANTIARSMDGPGGTHQLEQLAEMVVQVWRSQFISFLGNLVCAFPVAMLLADLFRVASGAPPASAAKAELLLASVHPWLGGALFYAAVAGVFLFMAGLVSGYFDNRNLYRGLSRRVARHPWLVRGLGAARAERAGAFVDKHGGALLGNVFLGICLGCAGTLGIILGLPFDIRHIAFSSANLGMALEGLDHAVSASVVAEAALGVMLIGLVNFVVSFGMTLSMALESRRITFRENRAVLRILLRRLARRPWHFFFPPREATAERA